MWCHPWAEQARRSSKPVKSTLPQILNQFLLWVPVLTIQGWALLKEAAFHSTYILQSCARHSNFLPACLHPDTPHCFSFPVRTFLEVSSWEPRGVDCSLPHGRILVIFCLWPLSGSVLLVWVSVIRLPMSVLTLGLVGRAEPPWLRPSSVWVYPCQMLKSYLTGPVNSSTSDMTPGLPLPWSSLSLTAKDPLRPQGLPPDSSL